ncbi:lectin-like, partial [Cetorhinus maximus]
RRFCSGGSAYFGRCYKFFSDNKTWIEAELFCQTLAPGSHLASVHLEGQNGFIQQTITKAKRQPFTAWIGLHDLAKEKAFLWTDGSPTDFTKWHQGEPNNAGKENCVHMNWNSDNWNDLSCDKKLPFVCSYKLLHY